MANISTKLLENHFRSIATKVYFRIMQLWFLISKQCNPDNLFNIYNYSFLIIRNMLELSTS